MEAQTIRAKIDAQNYVEFEQPRDLLIFIAITGTVATFKPVYDQLIKTFPDLAQPKAYKAYRDKAHRPRFDQLVDTLKTDKGIPLKTWLKQKGIR